MKKFYVPHALHYHGRDGEVLFVEYDESEDHTGTLYGPALYALEDQHLPPIDKIDLNDLVDELTKRTTRLPDMGRALRREVGLALVDTITLTAAGRCSYRQFHLGALFSLCHSKDIAALDDLQYSLKNMYDQKSSLSVSMRYQQTRNRIIGGEIDTALNALSMATVTRILGIKYPSMPNVHDEMARLDMASRALAQVEVHRLDASSAKTPTHPASFNAIVVSQNYLQRHGTLLKTGLHLVK